MDDSESILKSSIELSELPTPKQLRSRKMTKAFVAMSGGIDSTTVFHYAMGNYDEVEAISIDYGQRHKKEADFAKETCRDFKVKHTTLKVNNLNPANTMLTDSNVEIPDIDYADIKGVSPTYVPFRNGNIMAQITAYAQAEVKQRIDAYADINTMDVEPSMADIEHAMTVHKDFATVLVGIHAEDAKNWAYPDCTPEFFGAMANAVYIGTYFTVRLSAPILFNTKEQIIKWGTELGVDWSNTWSCYAGGDKHCGTCPTCRARKAGFIAAGVYDPTEYAS